MITLPVMISMTLLGDYIRSGQIAEGLQIADVFAKFCAIISYNLCKMQETCVAMYARSSCIIIVVQLFTKSNLSKRIGLLDPACRLWRPCEMENHPTFLTKPREGYCCVRMRNGNGKGSLRECVKWEGGREKSCCE
jgi:hypothetical protein